MPAGLGFNHPAPGIFLPSSEADRDAGLWFNATVLADGPVSYWRFNEPSGTVATDSVGTNHGTYVGSPTLGVAGGLPGDPDLAVQLTAASGQYVTVPDSASLAFGDGPMTFEMIYAWDGNASNQFLFCKGTQHPSAFVNSAGQVSFRGFAYNSDVSSGTVALQVGVKQHLVFTKNIGATWKIYIDGVDVTVVVDPSFPTAISTSNPLLIGTDGTTSIGGVLDEFVVYAKVLTARQVANHTASRVRLAPAAPGGAALAGQLDAIASVATATLTTAIQMVGAAVPAVANLPTAVLTTAIKLVGGTIAAISDLPTAALTTGTASLAGVVTAVSSLSTSALTTGINLVGATIPAVSNLPTAALTTAINLVGGTVVAVANLPTAVLTTAIKLVGATVPAVSNLATSTLTTATKLVGATVPAVSNLPTAALTTAIRLAGVVTAVSNLPGSTLATSILLAGQSAAFAALTASLSVGNALAGVVAGVSSLAGSLTTFGVDVPFDALNPQIRMSRRYPWLQRGIPRR